MGKSSHSRVLVLFFAMLLLSTVFALTASANAAEPPCFTVIVTNPPDDLSLSLEFSDGTQTALVPLEKERKAWEVYYRFFYHMNDISRQSFENAVLHVESGGIRFTCTIPVEAFREYNNFLALNMSTQNVTVGQPLLRVPLLIAMRVLLTLVIEGLIFYAFGFRRRNSWIAFFVINLITQGGLNAMLTGPMEGAYWLLVFIFCEFFIFVAEMIFFAIFVKEFWRGHSIIYALAANAASLVVGGILISYLPI